MCVLAAYLGDKPAAPVLLEMLARMEGLGGGYYTGVATVSEGRIHFEKVVGDVAALRATTGVEDLPGVLGIAHSRTPSGGDVEWAHPFLGDEAELAYVANGHLGHFASLTDYAVAGNGLLDRSGPSRSWLALLRPRYPGPPSLTACDGWRGRRRR